MVESVFHERCLFGPWMHRGGDLADKQGCISPSLPLLLRSLRLPATPLPLHSFESLVLRSISGIAMHLKKVSLSHVSSRVYSCVLPGKPTLPGHEVHNFTQSLLGVDVEVYNLIVMPIPFRIAGVCFASSSQHRVRRDSRENLVRAGLGQNR